MSYYSKIPYGTTDEGYKVLPSYTPSSHPYLPPIFIDKKVYIIQNAVERFNPIDKTPVSVVIDTIQKKQQRASIDIQCFDKRRERCK